MKNKEAAAKRSILRYGINIGFAAAFIFLIFLLSLLKKRFVMPMKKISIILIIAGVLLMAYPAAGKIYVKYQQDRLIREGSMVSLSEEIKNGIKSQYNSLQQIFERGNSENSGKITLGSDGAGVLEDGEAFRITGEAPGQAVPPAAETKPLPSAPEVKAPPENGDFLGTLYIKKIQAELPIVEGSLEKNLEISVGHLTGTTAIGEIGNTAIAGHRSHSFGWFFNRLDELVPNDEVIIRDTGGTVYTYKVFDKLIVEPTDLSVLNGSKTDSVLTLITCTPLYVASHRLIIHAVLVEKAD